MKTVPRITWPRKLMVDLICEALTNGKSEAILKSNREAKLFRFALYHVSRTENVRDLLTITVADRIVRLNKKQIEIKVVEDWKIATAAEFAEATDSTS